MSSTSEHGALPTASADTLPQSGVGQAFRNGPFRINVVSVEFGAGEIDLDGPDGIPPIWPVNGKFVRVYVTVKNVGSQPATFWGIGSTLEASGKEYLASGPYLVGGKEQGLFKEQQPGSVTRGWIAFDVPNSVTKLEAVNIQSDPDRYTTNRPTRVDLAEVNG